MHASTPDHPEGDSATIEGLVQGHAYSLLDVHTVTKDDFDTAKEIRLVKLRNPWG